MLQGDEIRGAAYRSILEIGARNAPLAAARDESCRDSLGIRQPRIGVDRKENGATKREIYIVLVLPFNH